MQNKTQSVESATESPIVAADTSETQLQTVIKKIRQGLSAADQSDLWHRYQVALEINSVWKDPENRYGQGAIKKLADEIGSSEENLRLYVHVPDAWTAEEFKQLMHRKDKRGMPICWTNLTYFAGISAKERGEWIEKFFEEGISIKEIKRLRQGEGSSYANKDDSSRDPHMRLKKHLRAMTGEMEGTAEKWQDLVFKPLREAPTQSFDEELRGQFEKARDQLQIVARTFNGLAQELSDFLAAAANTEPADSTSAIT